MSKKKESHGKLGGNLADVHMQEGYFTEEKIYERNKDTGAIRSRKPMDYGNETIEGSIDDVMDKVIHPLRGRIRAEALDELWAANKVNHKGHWYIRLTDVVNIMGDYDDLYENESRS
jgi:hypothetical protein